MSKYLFGEWEGPVYLRFGARGEEWSFEDNHRPVEMGRFEPLFKEEFVASDVTIIALGQLVKVGLEVARVLEKEGYRAFVFNARFVKPLVREMIENIVSNSKLVVSIEEHSLVGGLGDNLLRTFHRLEVAPSKLLKFGISSNFGVAGKREYLLKRNGLYAENIAKQVLALLC